MNVDFIRRLMQIDSALAEPDGMRVSQMAEELGVSTKTIRRDIEVLRACGCDIPIGDPSSGPFHVHRHAGERLFREAS